MHLIRMPVAMCVFSKISCPFSSRALSSGAFLQSWPASSSSSRAPISASLPVFLASKSFVCKDVCRLVNSCCNFSGPVSSGLDRRRMSWSLISMASSTDIPSQTISGEQVDEETKFWKQIEVHQKDAARLTSLEEARTLMDCSSTAMISTISQIESHPKRPDFDKTMQKFNGSPFGSLVSYATDGDGCPILAISSLSPHTKDLELNSKCSMLFVRDAMDIKDASVVVIGEAETVSDENRAEVRATYLKKHPDAFWVDFGDFRLVRVTPSNVRFFAGAGSVRNPEEFTGKEYKDATVDPIAPFTAPIAGHMNRDHAEQTKEIVESSLGVKIDYAKILHVDRLGFSVETARKGTPLKLRVPFPRPAENRKDVKNLIVEMLQGTTSSYLISSVLANIMSVFPRLPENLRQKLSTQ